MISLYPDQLSFKARISSAWKAGHRRVLGVAPCGFGKSATLGNMLASTSVRTLVLAHRIEILEQISAEMPVEHGVIAPGYKDTDHDVQIGMVQSVAKRLGRLPPFKFVVSDEAHLASSPRWSTVLNHLRGYQLGLSGTPCRLSGAGLGTIFDTMVFGPTVKELIAEGRLVPCRTFAPYVPDLLGVKRSAGDYQLDELAEVMSHPRITGNTIAEFREKAPGRRAMVFCVNRAHGGEVRRAFLEAGISAAYADGSMSKEGRREQVASAREGLATVLIGVELFTTGLDWPAVDCMICLRPTQSLALWLQMCGRVQRPFPGKKDALILDHSGNSLRLGRPADDRKWTLDGRAAKGQTVAIVRCPDCFSCDVHGGKCAECGWQKTEVARKRILVQRDGKLRELTDLELTRWSGLAFGEAKLRARTADDLRIVYELHKGRIKLPCDEWIDRTFAHRAIGQRKVLARVRANRRQRAVAASAG